MTFLQIINDVLVRMREDETLSVNSNSYVKLIGKLVNDAKRAVEDAADWTVLRTTVDITSVADTADYSLTNSNERTTVYDVIETDSKYILNRDHARRLIREKILEQASGRPTKWAIVGTDSTGQLSLRLSPTPDSARSYTVSCIIPPGDLVASSDAVTVPVEPVVLRAFAYAIKERGEDQGQAYLEALDQYRRALSRHLVLNGAHSGAKVWRVD